MIDLFQHFSGIVSFDRTEADSSTQSKPRSKLTLAAVPDSEIDSELVRLFQRITQSRLLNKST